MKKILAFLIILSFLMLSFASCDFSDADSSSSSSQSSSSSKKEETKSNLGDYNVVIDSFRMAEDYQGEDVIIVKYLICLFPTPFPTCSSIDNHWLVCCNKVPLVSLCGFYHLISSFTHVRTLLR